LALIVGGIPSNEHGYTAGLTQLQELTREATGTPTKETIRKRMEWLFHDPKVLPDELVDIRLKIYSDPAMQEVLQARDRKIYHLIDKIPKLQAPILFFWTTHNPTCPWPVAFKVHQSVPGSRFVLVDKSGHWPQYERDVEFNRTLLEFLSGSQDDLLIDTYRKLYWQ
jgi:2-hydroxy-6-oxonona-2,4-dienedioate hydrolase